MARIRKLKWPVLSRLTWAWLVFACCGAGVMAYTAFNADKRPAAIAMPVEAIERLAAPAERVAQAPSPERLAPATGVTNASLGEEADALEAPYARSDERSDFGAEPYSMETGDILALGEPGNFPGDPADEIVITIDGAPALAPGEKPAPTTARSAAAPTPIAATDQSMLRKTDYGMAPKIGPGGRRASSYYAKPFKQGEHPDVALIVGGLGLNRALTERAIDDLPANVTLAFAPYAKDLSFWTKRARDAGHEVLLELPMEDRLGAEDVLGPAALMTTRTSAENLQRLDWMLSRFDGFFGVTNYLGAKFTSDDAFDPVLRQIKNSGLAYFDDSGALRHSWHGEDKTATTVNRIIDPGFETDRSATSADLAALEKIAKRDGDAIGKTYANSSTLDVIADWAVKVGERELELAPASAVLAARAGAL